MHASFIPSKGAREISVNDNSYFSVLRAAYRMLCRDWRRTHDGKNPDFEAQKILVKKAIDNSWSHWPAMVKHAGYKFPSKAKHIMKRPRKMQSGTYSPVVPYLPGTPLMLGHNMNEEERRKIGNVLIFMRNIFKSRL